jgi:uracil DNA glycosylase
VIFSVEVKLSSIKVKAQGKRTLRAQEERAGRHQPPRGIESAHTSPLSARNGFFGSRPFSRINAALRAARQPEIDWRLPDL